ncbi:hydrogenase expression/formation protein HypE [Robertkochia marina]|uniref:Hydrogenase expression/formation protein HypE n=1 Tax=Robertkochia marina TaxID=1227945 RepID=A0A4S3LYR7_9FLAO|nr:hydrogenase expression/formation protein HypE [Robertkochia marina]THD66291.1 hydrogenase expression/formation protein HypE [Robertkochia marina]TRZ41212.1 hydrogenase expression/formation protein HypE [Robertkochia marina]
MDKKKIELGHGSGGLLTRELLDELIFSTFRNPYIDQKHDGAVLPLTGEVVISTDSFVVSPIFFKGGDIGELAVNGSVNDVAMCGGIPKYLSLAFIIEEGLPVEDLKKILQSISIAAKRSGVEVVTGDTKVVEKGKGDRIFINTTAVGMKHPGADITMSRILPGDQIIVNNSLAQHGMAIMSEREGLAFESAISSDTTNLNYVVSDILDRFGTQIHLLRDATRGGVAGVLSEIAVDTSLGVFLKEEAIPLQKQVAAACDLLGLDPLYVANEGVFLVVAHQDIAHDLLEALKVQDPEASPAIIGEITTAHPEMVVLESKIGGRRVVTPLIGEQLPRIC